MSDIDDKLKRLQDARKKAEDISKRRQRIAGELDGHKKRLAEIEKKCRDDYGCEIAELPKLSANLESEAEELIKEAERLLSVPAAPSKPVEPSKKQAETSRVAPKRPSLVRPSSDEDVL